MDKIKRCNFYDDSDEMICNEWCSDSDVSALESKLEESLKDNKALERCGNCDHFRMSGYLVVDCAIKGDPLVGPCLAWTKMENN